MDASAVFLIGGTCLAQQSDEKGFLEFIAARKLRRGTAKLALSKTANEEVSSLAGGIVAVYEGVASNLTPSFSKAGCIRPQITGRAFNPKVTGFESVLMLSDPHAVQILVDGSCFPQDKMRSGYGAIVHYPDGTNLTIVFQGFTESTINRMELGGVIAALKWVKDFCIGSRYSRVQISSDSQYVID